MAPIPPLLVESAFRPAVFSNTEAIEKLHNNIPRAGYSNNLLPLILGPKQQGKDYVKGVVIFVSVISLAFFIWSALILTFKCCFPKKTGFFSGKPPMKPLTPPGYVNKGHNTMKKEHADGDEHEQQQTSVMENDIDPSKCNSTAIELNQSELLLLPPEENIPVTISNKNKNNEEACRSQEGPSMADNHPLEEGNASIHNETNDQTNLQEIEDYENEVARVDKLLKRTRIVVFVAGGGVLVFSIVFMLQGINGLNAGVDNLILGLEKSKAVVADGVALCNDFVTEQGALNQNFVKNYENYSNFGWCPRLKNTFLQECGNGTEFIIEKLEDFRFVNFSLSENQACTDIIGIPIQVGIDFAKLFAQKIQNRIFKEALNLASDLMEINKSIDVFIGYFDLFRWAFWTSVGFTILLDLVVLFLLVGVILAWRQRIPRPFKCARSLIIVPLFVLNIFLVWLFASMACITAVMASDFCYDSPDTTLKAVLVANKQKFSSVVFKLGIYYLSRCPSELSPTVSLTNNSAVLLAIQAIRAVHDLIEKSSTVESAAFENICGIDLLPLNALGKELDAQFHIIFDALVGTKNLFSCSSISPIITTVSYQGICYHGVNGLYKVLISLFLIVVFSLIMITLRAAWQEEETLPDDLYFLEEKMDEPVSQTEDPPIYSGEGPIPPPQVDTSNDNDSAPPMETMNDNMVEPVLQRENPLGEEQLPHIPMHMSSNGNDLPHTEVVNNHAVLETHTPATE